MGKKKVILTGVLNYVDHPGYLIAKDCREGNQVWKIGRVNAKKQVKSLSKVPMEKFAYV